MSIKETLDAALKNAMRNSDNTTKQTVRMVLAAVKFEEVNKKVVLDDTAVISIIQKEIKSRNEVIADAKKINREDLISENLQEIAILEGFLPKQLTDDELKTEIQKIITAEGITDPKEMGKVIKLAMQSFQGKAPNDKISQVVRQLLS